MDLDDYYSCLLYSNVKNCLECPNKEKCTQCASLNYELVNDQTLCLLDSDKESNLYYYDETTNRYISCSIMENCIKCNSGDVCLSCKEGYQINDNKKCKKIKPESIIPFYVTCRKDTGDFGQYSNRDSG